MPAEPTTADPGRPRGTYQGRALPRPADDVADQGLGFDLGTLMDRRRLLRALGVGALTAGLAACATATTSSSSSGTGGTTTAASTTDGTATTEIPDETAGPYPGDGSNGPDVLTQSGVVRSDIRSSFGTGSATAEGVPMTLTLTVTDMANGNAPFAGVAVYVWHCDAGGNYSLYSSGLENENYLRGVQLADAAGRVTFTSIVPGCYSGRWPHIHFEVYPSEADISDAGNAIATSQVALPQQTCDAVYALPAYAGSAENLSSLTLATDNVFGDDGGAHQLGTVTGDVTNGVTVALTVPVDTRTTPTGGGAPAGGGAGGTPPGPPPSR